MSREKKESVKRGYKYNKKSLNKGFDKEYDWKGDKFDNFKQIQQKTNDVKNKKYNNDKKK